MLVYSNSYKTFTFLLLKANKFNVNNSNMTVLLNYRLQQAEI